MRAVIDNKYLRIAVAIIFLLLGSAMLQLRAYVSLFLLAVSLIAMLVQGNKFLEKVGKRNRLVVGTVAALAALFILVD